MNAIRIDACGPACSIQDAGRTGYSRLGIASAGAMDPGAMRVANALVGNQQDEAVIEAAHGSLRVSAVDEPVKLAVSGARADLDVGGVAVAQYRSVVIRAGETLRIGPARRGVYVMLAVAGGFAIAPQLGSRSLDLRAGIGGIGGRMLMAGDVLALRGTVSVNGMARWALPASFDTEAPIRIVFGPQADAFTARGLQTLIGRSFRVSHQSNRMAYRLDGAAVEHRPGFEMISDGTLRGSIQVPPDGQLLVLMADRQTVGGYPKIATVISSDLARLAQRSAGNAVSFVAVSVEEAREIARQTHLAGIDVRTGAPPVTAGHPSLDNLAMLSDAVVDAADARTWSFDVDDGGKR